MRLVCRAPAAFVVAFALLAAAIPAFSQVPEPLGVDTAQQRLEEIVVTSLDRASARRWSTDVAAARVTAGTAPSLHAEDEVSALTVEMTPQAFTLPRVAIYAPEPIRVPGITKTITADIWTSVGRLMNFRVIIHDNRGIEYKVPATTWGVPDGNINLTVVVSPAIIQWPPRRVRQGGIFFAGIELLPIPNTDVPPEGFWFALTEVRAITDIFEGYGDSDQPEDWE